jgi:hypothetical protein
LDWDAENPAWSDGAGKDAAFAVLASITAYTCTDLGDGAGEEITATVRRRSNKVWQRDAVVVYLYDTIVSLYPNRLSAFLQANEQHKLKLCAMLRYGYTSTT